VAGNGVSVAITAQDRASATLERINSRLARMQLPARRAFGALQRFSQVTGLTRLRGGLTSVAREGVSAFRSIGQIAPVLGTITGATSVAGIYRLASAWAKMGTEIRTTSHAIGIAPERLAKLQNAARLSGGSGEAVTGALQSLSQTQWEMAHGFAPEAQATFQALFNGTGTSIKQIEQMKPDELFDRLIKRLRGIKNPAAQAIAAQKLFGGAAAGLLPILQQTEKEYQTNIRLAERYGVTNQKGADAAANLQHSIAGLTLAGEGLAYSIAEALGPSVQKIIDRMAEWIGQHRALIALRLKQYFDEVSEAVSRVVKWLQDGGWDKITWKIRSVVDALGGWKGVAAEAVIAVGALYAAPVLLGMASFALQVMAISKAFDAMKVSAEAANGAAGVPGKSGKGGILRKTARVAGYLGIAGIVAEGVQQGADALGWQNKSARISAGIDRKLGTNLPYAYQAYKYFTSQGWSSAQAAGLVSNLDVESGFNYKDDTGDGGKAYGAAQWHAPRQADFEKQFGHSIRNSTFDEQMQFVQWELTHTYKNAGDTLRRAGNETDAAQAVSAFYEQPKDQLGEMSRRGALAPTWRKRLEERDRYGANGFAGWAHDLRNRLTGSLDAASPSQPDWGQWARGLADRIPGNAGNRELPPQVSGSVIPEPQPEWGQWARGLANRMQGGEGAETVASPPGPGPADWGKDLISGLKLPSAEPSIVKIEIDNKNALLGAKVKATSSSPSVQIASVRTSRAMDPTSTATGN